MAGMSNDVVTPNEMARSLGVTGLRLRNWLRDRAAAGDPRVGAHQKHERWEFDPALAAELMADFRREVFDQSGTRGRTAGPVVQPVGSPPHRRAKAKAAPGYLRSSDPGHRVREEWMGEEIETLEDLLRPGLLAVCVGINPAPRSVAAGHYYQGNYGQRFFARLRVVGLIPMAADGYEDDAAFASGVGFTDLVKRPTPSDEEVTDEEREYGRPLLEQKLSDAAPRLAIFAFKSAARTLFGRFDGNGFVPSLRLASCEVFVMPGPTENTRTAEPTLAALASRVRELRDR